MNALHTTFDDCARRSLPYRSEEEWSRQERRDYSIAVAWGWDLVLTRDMEPLGRWRGDGCYKTRNVWLQRLRFLEANPDERELFAAELARLRARFDEIVLAERKNPQAFIPRVEPLVEETEALVTWRDSVQTSRHEPAVHQSKRWERNIETERRRARTGNQAFRELVDW